MEGEITNSADAHCVFVVDDNAAVRAAICDLVESVGLTAKCYDDAMAFLDDFDPTVVACALVDERMPRMTGRALQHAMQARGFEIPLVMMTGYADVQMAVEAMKLGAFDFIQKPFRDQELIEVVHRALDAAVQRRRVRSERRKFDECVKALTPREREVMTHVVNGETNALIAEQLGISKRTVELHRMQLIKKMDAGSIIDIVRKYSMFSSD